MTDRGTTSNPFLLAARPLTGRGVACHWLRSREKRPVLEKWSTAPVATYQQLEATYRPGYNIGVRPGEHSKVGKHYLHLFDLDVRREECAEEAWESLLALLPEARGFPMVVSGSGGESRHIYMFSDRPLRSRKLAKSKTQSPGADGKPKDDWSVALYGNGLQAVLPPSIHPVTGQPYRWLREIDWDLLDMDLGPIVSADRVASWGVQTADRRRPDEDDDDLLSITRRRPLGLHDDEIDAVLRDLPFDEWGESRDGWLQVGMALHHEYEGSVEGFEKWCAFSQASGKFDPEDQERVWRSFHNAAGNPVRMATLIKAAKEARLDRSYDFEAIEDDGTEDEIADLLGPDPAAEEDADDDKSWRKQLDLTEEGAIKNTASNLSLIIQFDPRIRGCVELNEFTQEVVTRKPVRSKLAAMVHIPVEDTINGDLWQDHHERNVRMLLESARGKKKSGYGIKVTDRDLSAAIDIAARRRSFHPVREYLEKLKWDGRERMARLFIDYLGAPDTAYSREIARLTLLGAVTRAYEPGHKFDFVTILEGFQGKRKSTFIAILARHWFAELQGNFDDRKQLVETMQGAWILEIPELSGFSRTEVQAIKAFVSARKDKVRLSYARRAAEFKRQCIFIGSTNETEYLKDNTGGRRIWPVHCTVEEIDTERLEREVDQMWAETVAAYRAMRAEQPHGQLRLFLADRDAQAEALAMQESRRIETAEDSMAGEIEAWLDREAPESVLLGGTDHFDNEDDLLGEVLVRRNEVCLKELWCECMKSSTEKYNQQAAQLLGRAMQRLRNWEMIGPRYTPKYGMQRIYRRKGSVERFGSA